MHIAEALGMPRMPGPSTVSIHGRDGGSQPLVTPLVRATAHRSGGGWTYSRFSNPTLDTVAERIAALEDAESGILVGSGTAAIACSLLATTPCGRHRHRRDRPVQRREGTADDAAPPARATRRVRRRRRPRWVADTARIAARNGLRGDDLESGTADRRRTTAGDDRRRGRMSPCRRRDV